eukprot:1708104-Pleurochrysis_carterae.AAC.1
MLAPLRQLANIPRNNFQPAASRPITWAWGKTFLQTRQCSTMNTQDRIRFLFHPQGGQCTRATECRLQAPGEQ